MIKLSSRYESQGTVECPSANFRVSYLSKLKLLQLLPNCNANLIRLNIGYKYRAYKKPNKNQTKSLNTRNDL